MNGEQLGVVPRLNFNGSALSLSGLGRILEMLNASGSIDVRGIAPGSVNLLELGAALRWITPIPMSTSFVHRTLVGWTARKRVLSEVSLWIRRNGRPIYRTSYVHKLLRYPVVVETTKYEDIGL